MSRGDAADEAFMRLAIRMGARGLGSTRPNPAVGAVVVASGSDGHPVVAGRGWTQPGGRPHAETEALARARALARGATLYVTLEPCSHQGRTPPCTDAILAAGIARVVAGIRDPDKRVSGQGFSRLRAAGLSVRDGVCAREAAWGLAGHVLHRGFGRPFVQLKLAMSADGRVAAGTGKPVWVTGDMARAAGHLMRAACEAIIVGRGTVEADDPELTCRLPGLEGRSPVRVVLDSALHMPPASKLARSAGQLPVWVMCSPQAALAGRAPDGITAIAVEPAAGGGLDPSAVLAALAAREITRVLIEGGPSVAASFLGAGLVDELVLFRSPAILGEAGRPALPASLWATIEDRSRWQLAEERELAQDRLIAYRNLASPLWALALANG